uniref:Salivary secreted protein n=1 Tax=Triatoma infestans TaxID=30076 RepID=A6YPU2_TRIIF|nr:putative salivary secreted protein [Triatoma infestans]
MDVIFKNIWTLNAFVLLASFPLMTSAITGGVPYCLQQSTYDLYLGQEPVLDTVRTDAFTANQRFKKQVTWNTELVAGTTDQYKIKNLFQDYLLAVDKTRADTKEASVISRTATPDDSSNIWTLEVYPSHVFLKNNFNGQYLYAPNTGGHNLALTRPLSPETQDLYKWKFIDCSTQ